MPPKQRFKSHHAVTPLLLAPDVSAGAARSPRFTVHHEVPAAKGAVAPGIAPNATAAQSKTGTEAAPSGTAKAAGEGTARKSHFHSHWRANGGAATATAHMAATALGAGPAQSATTGATAREPAHSADVATAGGAVAGGATDATDGEGAVPRAHHAHHDAHRHQWRSPATRATVVQHVDPAAKEASSTDVAQGTTVTAAQSSTATAVVPSATAGEVAEGSTTAASGQSASIAANTHSATSSTAAPGMTGKEPAQGSSDVEAAHGNNGSLPGAAFVHSQAASEAAKSTKAREGVAADQEGRAGRLTKIDAWNDPLKRKSWHRKTFMRAAATVTAAMPGAAPASAESASDTAKASALAAGPAPAPAASANAAPASAPALATTPASAFAPAETSAAAPAPAPAPASASPVLAPAPTPAAPAAAAAATTAPAPVADSSTPAESVPAASNIAAPAVADDSRSERAPAAADKPSESSSTTTLAHMQPVESTSRPDGKLAAELPEHPSPANDNTGGISQISPDAPGGIKIRQTQLPLSTVREGGGPGRPTLGSWRHTASPQDKFFGAARGLQSPGANRKISWGGVSSLDSDPVTSEAGDTTKIASGGEKPLELKRGWQRAKSLAVPQLQKQAGSPAAATSAASSPSVADPAATDTADGPEDTEEETTRHVFGKTKSWSQSARAKSAFKPPARHTARVRSPSDRPSDATESTISFPVSATGQHMADSPSSTPSGSPSASPEASPRAVTDGSPPSTQNTVSDQATVLAEPGGNPSARLSWSSRKKAAAERLTMPTESAVDIVDLESTVGKDKEILHASSPSGSPRGTPQHNKMKWIRKKLLKLEHDGKINFETLFNDCYDSPLSHHGNIDWETFLAIIRRHAHVSASVVSDDELFELFCILNKSGDGSIHYKVDFVPWLHPHEEDIHEGHKSAKEIELAVTELKRHLKAAAYDNGKKDYKKLFAFHDKNHSGSIEFDEFRAVVRKLGKITAAILTDDDVFSLFNSIDTNGDHTLSFEYEFVPWLLNDRERQSLLRRQVKEQAKLQAVHDGTDDAVTPTSPAARAHAAEKEIQRLAREKEIEAVVAKLKNRFKAQAFNNGKRDILKLFHDFDENNDGEINFEEFRGNVRKNGKITKAMLSDEELHDLFRQVHGSEAGFVSYEEFSDWVLAEKEEVLKEEEEQEEHKLTDAVIACIQRIKAMLQSSHADLNWSQIFREIDRTGSGIIDFEGFRHAFRIGAHIPPSVASDSDLLSLFKFIDKDDSNIVRYKSEFLTWLRSEDGLCPLQNTPTRKSVAVPLPGSGEGLPLKQPKDQSLSLTMLEEGDTTNLGLPQRLEESPIWPPLSPSPLATKAVNYFDTGHEMNAQALLNSVDTPEIRSWRGFPQPPTVVECVLGSVHCLLGLEEDWPNVQRHMRPMSSFLKELREFDPQTVSLPMLQRMRRRLRRCPAGFSPQHIEPVSSSCAALCQWVNLMCRLASDRQWHHPDSEVLRRLDKQSMSELGCLNRPHLLVATVMGNVHCLLGLPPQWPQIQHSLRCYGEFLHRLQYFKQECVTQQIKDSMLQRHKMMPSAFHTDIISKVNSTCAVFCEWVNAVCSRAGLDFPQPATRSVEPSPSALLETSWASISELSRICLPATASLEKSPLRPAKATASPNGSPMPTKEADRGEENSKEEVKETREERMKRTWKHYSPKTRSLLLDTESEWISHQASLSHWR